MLITKKNTELAKKVQRAVADLKTYLMSFADSTPQALRAGVVSILDRPAKMLRPQMLFTAACLRNGPTEADIKTAAGVELLHNSSLVHDDIMDEAETRRGSPTIHKEFSSDYALLIGDYLIAEALNHLEKFGGPFAVREGISTYSIMTVAQGQELNLRNKPVTTKQVNDIALGKTAAMFKLSIILGADPKYRDELAKFAVNFGTAFQYTDDLSDIDTDLKEGTPTLPIVLTLNKASAEEKDIITKAQAGKTELLAQAEKIISNSSSIDLIKKRIDQDLRTALHNIEKLPSSEITNTFVALIDKVRALIK